jgi:maltose O-acetyltransferase
MNLGTQPDEKGLKRFFSALRDDTFQLRFNLLGAELISRALPARTGNKLRVELLRWLGFEVGEGTQVAATPRIRCMVPEMRGKLAIGRDCMIGMGVSLDLGAKITLGDDVTLGHGVLILTTSHELGPREHRAGKLMYGEVTIGAGAWLGARVVVLPGISIGEGAVVVDNSLVNKNVPAHTRVAGVPARGSEKLEP